MSRVAKASLIALATAFALAHGDEPAAVHWSDEAVATFVGREAAGEILRADDDFLKACGRFDIAARMKTTRKIERPEFAAWLADDAIEWDDATRQKVVDAMNELRPKLAPLARAVPKRTTFALVAGRAESGAAYTRATTIVLTKARIGEGGAGLQRLLLHELFHVISRQDPDLRGKLYRVIGFDVCPKIEAPQELADAKITNPDAPWWNCVLSAAVDGRESKWTPVLTASPETWTPESGKSFFEHVRFRFLEVEPADEPGAYRPVARDGKSSFREPKELPEFARAIGRNTGYVIHPDEILADNFVHLALETPDLPSPEIVERMREAWPTK